MAPAAIVYSEEILSGLGSTSRGFSSVISFRNVTYLVTRTPFAVSFTVRSLLTISM